MKRPRIAILGLNGCSGCQLSLFNAESDLPRLLQAVELVRCPLVLEGDGGAPYDLALVEGAVSSTAERAALLRLRQESSLLVAVGSCAAWGGIASCCRHLPRQQLHAAVYGVAEAPPAGEHPAALATLVTVDGIVPGCPPEAEQLLQLLAAAGRGVLPPLPDYAVCTECRSREIDCLLTEYGQLCLGPVTRAGCRARCPAVDTPCEGCRGPVAEANLPAGRELLARHGHDAAAIASRLHRFCPEWPDDQKH